MQQILIQMKKINAVLLLLLLFAVSNAQEYAKYWVQFKDKSGSPYSVSAPEAFLSERAIQLRQKHHIPIDERDIPVNAAYIQQVLAVDSNMRLCTQSKWMNGITVYSEREGIMDSILLLPCVAFVEKTVPMTEPETSPDTPFVFSRPADAVVKRTYLADIEENKDFDYGTGENQIRMNNGHWLHRLGFRGENMRMMVMDGGFQNVDTLFVFRNLHQDNRLLGARNLVQPEKNPFRKHTHGTSVLSCIAAYVPGKLVGTAPMVEVYLCQTEDARSENKVEEDNWVAGLELADSMGCQVLNSSLGYTTFDDSTQVRKYEDLNGHVSRASQAAAIAVAKGMIVCNSAGNEGSKKWRYLGAPADADGILSVGAVDAKGRIANFSSHGPAADGRVKPDVCAVGLGCFVSSAKGFAHFSAGTSFSSPILSGMVACLWEAFPEKSNVEIMDAVRRSGDRYDTPDSLYGYGIPDMLTAYNLLLQPENATFSISTDAFVAEDNLIDFKLVIPNGNNAPKTIEVTVVSPALKKPIVKTFTLNHPTDECSLKLPALAKNEKYRFYDMEIRLAGHETLHYVFTQEKQLENK